MNYGLSLVLDFVYIQVNHTLVPYILAYKSQNLPQNLELEVGGATYTRVIK